MRGEREEERRRGRTVLVAIIYDLCTLSPLLDMYDNDYCDNDDDDDDVLLWVVAVVIVQQINKSSNNSSTHPCRSSKQSHQPVQYSQHGKHVGQVSR